MMNTTTTILEKTSFFKSCFTTFFAFLLILIIGTFNASSQSTKAFKTASDELVVYSDVPGLTPSEKYTIKVRSAATNNVWIDVFAHYTYNSAFELQDIDNVDGNNNVTTTQAYQNHTSGWSHTYGNIEMNNGQAVEVEIAAKNGFKIGGQNFFKATVHPAQKASAATLVNGKIYFTITKPAQIVIDINGQMDDYNAAITSIGHPVHAISLFANPILKKPSLNNTRVRYIEPGTTLAAINNTAPATYDTMYFKPGIHDLARGIKLHPGKTYFIAGDAIVYGTLDNENVPAGTYSSNGENIKIFGYGTLSARKIPHYQFIYAYPQFPAEGNDKAILIENPVNCEVYGLCTADNAAHAITISGAVKWAKVISWRANGDGISIYGLVEDCFIRASDDCSYAKGDRRRCTFWKDANAALFHMATIPEDSPLIIEDCDVLYARLRNSVGNNGGGFQQRGGGFEGQRTVNVIIRNFRIHDKLTNMPIFGLVSYEGDYTAPSNIGSSYKGILFQNISIAGMAPGNKQRMLGCAGAPWDGGITYDSITIGGTLLTQQNFTTYFITNEYVKNIAFNASVNHTVSLSAGTGGTVSGGGSFNLNQSITVKATPLAGRSFVKWTENGVSVSTNANYTFTVTQNRSLVAHFFDVSTIPNVTDLTGWVSGNTNNKVSASNRLMTVMVMGESTTDFSAASVTYGGQPMTKQIEKMHTDVSRSYAAIFTLNEAGVNAATSGSIVVNWSATPSSGSSLYSVLLANVNQTTPVMASASNSLTGTTVATNALSAGNGDMVIMCGATAKNEVITFNNGFTNQFESNTSWGDGVGGSKLGIGTTETPSFTQSASGRMALCAIVVKHATVTTISDNSKALDQVKIYPIPASDIINIDFTDTNQSKEIKIYTILGEQVYQHQTNDATTRIDVKSLNLNGVVIIQIIEGNSIFNQKIFIKN